MLTILNHPLIHHKLTIMRDLNTPTKEFSQLLGEIAAFMAYEITKDLPLKDITVKTAITTGVFKTLARDVVLVPILRAGLGMVEGIRALIPAAKIGHIGIYRNESTLEPCQYFTKLPANIGQSDVFVLDPMLATGGSAAKAIDILKKNGATNISMVSIVGVKEGISKLEKDHPDVPIFLASLDEKLNEKGYIVPGLGDAGDRIFGTK